MAIYPSHSLGKRAETAACTYLEKQGFILITKNFRTRMGEIDLIMRDQDTIVFIEVRSRLTRDHGKALESIEESKVKKLITTATIFLQQKGWLEKKVSRFDVIAFDLENNRMQLEWIKNAF
jgi:putative endonuclease